MKRSRSFVFWSCFQIIAWESGEGDLIDWRGRVHHFQWYPFALWPGRRRG